MLLMIRSGKPITRALRELGVNSPAVMSFRDSLGRFISFNQSRQKAVALLPAALKKLPEPKRKADWLDKLAGLSERIQPYSAAAVGVATASVR